MAQSPVPVASMSREEAARALISGLQREATRLQELAEAARRPFLRLNLEPNAQSRMSGQRQELKAMEQLQFLFHLRACALLELGRHDDAARDVLTSLHLARLARQSPDVLFALREQIFLVRSLQPIWEGMAAGQWTSSQLAEFQTELAGFNLMTDYTNSVGRLVRSSIGIWSAMPDARSPRRSVLTASGVFISQEGWQLQPRGWWLDRCIQLHQAGQEAIGRVDFAGGRYRRPEGTNWDDDRGLPLDEQSRQLLQQYNWYNSNPSFMAFAQTAVNQAIIACALERYQIAQGRYPEKLEELIPDYLDRIPSDLLSGLPLIYYLREDDRYCLRGVGPNLKDDRRLKSSDDWLWTYSTNAPAKPR